MFEYNAPFVVAIFLVGATLGGAFVAAVAHAELRDIRRKLREMYPHDGW